MDKKIHQMQFFGPKTPKFVKHGWKIKVFDIFWSFFTKFLDQNRLSKGSKSFRLNFFQADTFYETWNRCKKWWKINWMRFQMTWYNKKFRISLKLCKIIWKICKIFQKISKFFKNFPENFEILEFFSKKIKNFSKFFEIFSVQQILSRGFWSKNVEKRSGADFGRQSVGE